MEKEYWCGTALNVQKASVESTLLTEEMLIFKDHLWKAHGITPIKSTGIIPGTSQMRLDLKGWSSGAGVKRVRASTTGLNASVLRSAYLNWTVADSLPFKMVRSTSFRMFLELINPIANQMLPRSDIAIRSDLLRAVHLRRPDIEKALAAARSRIHLIVDAWTSPNTYALFGVKCRFLDRDYQLQDVLLGLSRIAKRYSGAELAELLFTVTEAYRCTEQIGFLVSDNASTLDTMVNCMETKLNEADITWPADFYRLRCLGHIVHLTAIAFLEAKMPSLPAFDNREDWRNFGCYGKLHNIVVWVQQSPQRMERFRSISDFQLVRNNSTRWHSYYDMCHRALQVKDALIALTVQEMDLEAEALTASEWEHLANLTEFLYPFRSVTKANEGLLDTIDRMLPAFEFLLGHLERSRQDYAGNQWMSIRIDAAWEKLTKYYAKSDDTAAYMTATVLNPLHKWQWFEESWGTNRALQQWLRKGKQDLRLHWLKHYADVTSALMLTFPLLSSTTGAATGFAASLHRQD